MFKLEIKKSDIITDRVLFETIEELNLYLSDRSINSPFGLPERPELNDSREPTGVLLPPEFEISIQEIIPSYSELRKTQYLLRIDPKLSEAITEKALGDNTTMEALLLEKALIKLEIPKPE